MNITHTYVDDCLRLSVTTLSRGGYIRPGFIVEGLISVSNAFWGRYVEVPIKVTYGHESAPVLVVGNDPGQTYDLVYLKSNLGKGGYWLAQCPRTGHQFRKLYLYNGRVQTLKEFRGSAYTRQSLSNRQRKADRDLSHFFKSDRAYMAIGSRYFKPYYRGKQTRRHTRLLAVYEKGANLSDAEIMARFD